MMNRTMNLFSLQFLTRYANITEHFYKNEYAPVAQLDRVSDSDSEGRGFEFRRACQKKTNDNLKKIWVVICVTNTADSCN